MTLTEEEYRADRALRAMRSLGEAAQKNGTADTTMEEIDAEIAEARDDRLHRDTERKRG